MRKRMVERFVSYVKDDTQSVHRADTYPSSLGQLAFGKKLAAELVAIGLTDVVFDEYGYVMATLPSNIDRDVPTIGFLAHMDTSPDFSGKNIAPQVTKNYDGAPIQLQNNVILTVEEFPLLRSMLGDDIITADGTTLLGADDKAGIAIIVTAMEHLIQNPTIPHGAIKIGFTPDEEVGTGVQFFDVKKFGADFAYTFDGGIAGNIEYESFNAATAIFRVHGKSVHPGSAKNVMVNAGLIAAEITSLFPSEEIPACTEGYEGFYHLSELAGNCAEATMVYILRDHNKEKFELQKHFVQTIAATMNEKHGAGTVELSVEDSYYNMRTEIEKVPAVFDLVTRAVIACDLTPNVTPIRGGTDGSRLSYMGLPCPNVFVGGINAHGPYEAVSIQQMEKGIQVLLTIVALSI